MSTKVSKEYMRKAMLHPGAHTAEAQAKAIALLSRVRSKTPKYKKTKTGYATTSIDKV
jgi:hypothetical protein